MSIFSGTLSLKKKVKISPNESISIFGYVENEFDEAAKEEISVF